MVARTSLGPIMPLRVATTFMPAAQGQRTLGPIRRLLQLFTINSEIGCADQHIKQIRCKLDNTCYLANLKHAMLNQSLCFFILCAGWAINTWKWIRLLLITTNFHVSIFCVLRLLVVILTLMSIK